jgi:hypothetical protein
MKKIVKSIVRNSIALIILTGLLNQSAIAQQLFCLIERATNL